MYVVLFIQQSWSEIRLGRAKGGLDVHFPLPYALFLQLCTSCRPERSRGIYLNSPPSGGSLIRCSMLSVPCWMFICLLPYAFFYKIASAKGRILNSKLKIKN
jgi:Na+/melibiose symporter-like transporter